MVTPIATRLVRADGGQAQAGNNYVGTLSCVLKTAASCSAAAASAITARLQLATLRVRSRDTMQSANTLTNVNHAWDRRCRVALRRAAVAGVGRRTQPASASAEQGATRLGLATHGECGAVVRHRLQSHVLHPGVIPGAAEGAVARGACHALSQQPHLAGDASADQSVPGDRRAGHLR